MNKIPATIIDIKSCDILNIVEFQFDIFKMSMMSLQLSNLHVNDKVILTVKPSSVAIGKNLSGDLSYSNQLKGEIKSIKIGNLLCFLEVYVGDTIIQSVITKNSANRLNLEQNDKVVCIIKASDLSILEAK